MSSSFFSTITTRVITNAMCPTVSRKGAIARSTRSVAGVVYVTLKLCNKNYMCSMWAFCISCFCIMRARTRDSVAAVVWGTGKCTCNSGIRVSGGGVRSMLYLIPVMTCLMTLVGCDLCCASLRVKSIVSRRYRWAQQNKVLKYVQFWVLGRGCFHSLRVSWKCPRRSKIVYALLTICSWDKWIVARAV